MRISDWSSDVCSSDLGAFDARWCLVHATHMTPAESAAMAKSGAVAGLCPITEANLGDGIFPAGDFVAADGRYGVGSDSNILIDAAEELRLLEYGPRLDREGGVEGKRVSVRVELGGSRVLKKTKK